MARLCHTFSSLEGGIEELHEVLDQWMERSHLGKSLSSDGSRRMRTIAHEWIANLIRHAEFGAADPDVQLLLIVRSGSIRIEVSDNSKGFDLDREKERRKDALDQSLPPDRQLGIPLMMKSAEDIRYQQDGKGTNTVIFQIVPDR